ncbi:vitamin K epoxide reductase family protein [bacterium]|nr:vitamin K epoxide reductase family protein [bacterium]
MFKKLSVDKSYPYILIITGVIGIASSFFLSVDKFKILQNPAYKPSCNLNPILACGDVLKTHQGSAFGFPNPFIGLAAFAVFVTIGMGMLAGAKYKKWFHQGLQLGTILGLAFISWLFYQSLYKIHALCPWCMAVWAIVIISFWYTLIFNIDHGFIKLPKNLKAYYPKVRKIHLEIIIIFFLVLTLFILNHFWYYFGKHL